MIGNREVYRLMSANSALSVKLEKTSNPIERVKIRAQMDANLDLMSKVAKAGFYAMRKLREAESIPTAYSVPREAAPSKRKKAKRVEDMDIDDVEDET